MHYITLPEVSAKLLHKVLGETFTTHNFVLRPSTEEGMLHVYGMRLNPFIGPSLEYIQGFCAGFIAGKGE